MTKTIDDQYEAFIYLMWSNIAKATQKAAGVEYQVISKAKMLDVLTKTFPNKQIILNDEKYYLTNINTWRKIIKFDWTAMKKYLVDRYDCDNYSDAFRAHASELYGLNSAGRMSCSVKVSATGEIIPHRAVMIVALDNHDEIGLWAYESQNEGLCKVEAGGEIDIANSYGTSWIYTPTYFDFN